MIAQTVNGNGSVSSSTVYSEKKVSTWWRKFTKNKLLFISSIFCAALVFAVVFAPLFTDQDPNKVDLTKILLQPGRTALSWERTDSDVICSQEFFTEAEPP